MLKNIKVTLAALRRDEEGVTLVEYGIAITLAVLVGTGALATLGGDINTELGAASAVMT